MATHVLDLDGSEGEGGGQILRSALSLSLVTGTPFRLRNVRAGRSKPGLLRQHLTALTAAARVGAAEVEGARLGATEVTFHPHDLVGGEHRFAVGGAGSATLVLQTVLPALLVAPTPSRLVLEGGTHNPWAPPWDFLDRAFLPLLRRMGAQVESALTRRGYYPAGGGRFTASIEPVRTWQPLHLPARGAVTRRRARVLLANLPVSIADAEAEVLGRRLPSELWSVEREIERDDGGPGNAVLLEVESEHMTEVFSGMGSPEVRAATVVDEAVDEYRAWLAADVPVGPHLADQLLVPMAVGAGGSFHTVAPTRHTRTNADVIARFAPGRTPRFATQGPAAVVTVPGPSPAPPSPTSPASAASRPAALPPSPG